MKSSENWIKIPLQKVCFCSFSKCTSLYSFLRHENCLLSIKITSVKIICGVQCVHTANFLWRGRGLWNFLLFFCVLELHQKIPVVKVTRNFYGQQSAVEKFPAQLILELSGVNNLFLTLFPTPKSHPKLPRLSSVQNYRSISKWQKQKIEKKESIILLFFHSLLWPQ